ncbi:MAG TPA: helix-turn-helix domain-containing protein, partial [Acidimicrobiales bacterium]|nr:helix-turn-helix domain-containing protein [Acidimicrobiales bacterium]
RAGSESSRSRRSSAEAEYYMTQSHVAVLQWPAQADDAAALAADGRPRLLLVAPEADPPGSTDYLEEWVRLPADERDVAARLQTLATRAEVLAPHVDGSDRLLYRNRWVGLSPIEARLAKVLVENFEQVVHEADLGRRGWPDDEWPGAALRVHLTRLRRKLARIGLEIPTVRRHGVVLQPSGREPGQRRQARVAASSNGSISR